MNLFQLSAAAAAAALATSAFAAPVPRATERALSESALPTVLARESEPGDDRRGRGRGRDDPKAIEQAPATTIAREAERGDDHGDDGDEFEIDDHA